MLEEFVELFESGDFVSFASKFSFAAIESRERREKQNEVAKKIYSKFDPPKIAENFFELDEWERNKLAFAVAVNSVAKGLATSQIRKILNMSAKIYRNFRKKQDISKDVVRLNYTLAYTLGRQKQIEPVAEVLSKVLPQLKNGEKNYEEVHDFLQAVVAYHKLLGGRD